MNSSSNTLIAQRRTKGTIRNKIELDLLKHLPPEYKTQNKEFPKFLIIQIIMNTSACKSMERIAKTVQFDIVISPDFPLAPPKIRTISSVYFMSI